jgi:DNA replication protein DnaD
MDANTKIEGAKASGSRVRHRLGIVGLPGFSPLPHLLLMHQKELALTDQELNVFLNIYMHWYDAGRLPFPHTTTIAKRMNVSQRVVQNTIKSLREKGLLDKIPGERRTDPVRYDPKPLLIKLEPHARKWAALREKERPTELSLEALL